MNELEMTIKVAKAYNNLNFEEIEEVLSEDVIYESQNVLTPLYGKVELKTYLDEKFKLIKSSDRPVFAEMGFLGIQNKNSHNELSDYNGRPCVILSQGDKENKGALILVEINNDKIERIDICTVAPNWREATSTHKYPK